ncbi:YdcF family protein [Clostridium pasteurianum]|uniref:YdcF family protein n=1 Tax=Clostridium pasteurianum TaxID=1501 RepID=UPI001F3C0910|nr:YdcF family protein [Clostridium pasteurianum]
MDKHFIYVQGVIFYLVYFIKFLYSTFILPPGIFVLLLIIFSFKLFRYKVNLGKKLLILSIAFYICTIPIAGNSAIRLLENRYKVPANPSGDVIIMLGGGSTLDTPNLGFNGHLSGFAANRLLTSIQLYKKLNIPIIVSGGKVYKSTGTESEISKNILMSMGVPENKIIVENKSINTEQNVKFTKEILNSNNYKKPILVTSAFHMQRAAMQFKKSNVVVLPFPTDYQTNINEDLELNDFIPSSDSMVKLSLSVKEFIGILASYF